MTNVIHVDFASGDRVRGAFDLYERACLLDENPETFAEAVALYHQALKLDPKLAIALTNLGNIAFRQGEPDEAMALYHRALAIEPEQAEAQFNVGYLLIDRGQAGDAIPFFEGSIRARANFTDAYFYIATCRESLGDREGARPAWTRYLALDPSGYWADIARRHLAGPTRAAVARKPAKRARKPHKETA